MENEDLKLRIELAEAMGWAKGGVDTANVLGRPISVQRWIDSDGKDRAPYSLPDPFTDANDDYAVLQWAKKQGAQFWDIYCSELMEVVGSYAYLWEYHVGYYASAAVRVLQQQRKTK